MLDERGRDIGEPICEVVYLPATPELVAKTRANFERVLGNIHTKMNGYPTKATVYWDGVPEEDLPLLREYEKSTGHAPAGHSRAGAAGERWREFRNQKED